MNGTAADRGPSEDLAWYLCDSELSLSFAENVLIGRILLNRGQSLRKAHWTLCLATEGISRNQEWVAAALAQAAYNVALGQEEGCDGA